MKCAIRKLPTLTFLEPIITSLGSLEVHSKFQAIYRKDVAGVMCCSCNHRQLYCLIVLTYGLDIS